MASLDKHIWEGWTAQDFVNELEDIYPINYDLGRETSELTTKKEVKEWCMDNQPYYKKHIPEVVNYFCIKYGIKK